MADKKLLTAYARDMRWHPTQAEEELWRVLRNEKSLLGKFRRQHPFGDRFIADFISLEQKLIIEIDGDGHNSANDASRDAYMINEGYRILRFTADDTLSRMPYIIEHIAAAIGITPTRRLRRHPPPSRGRDK